MFGLVRSKAWPKDETEAIAALVEKATGEKLHLGETPESFLPKLRRALEAGAIKKRMSPKAHPADLHDQEPHKHDTSNTHK
jgi:hypothetical protein